MDQTFTQNDIVAYLYGESTPAQMRNTEAALAGDPVLRREFAELTQAQVAIPRVRFSARRRLLQVVRNYALGPDLQLSV